MLPVHPNMLFMNNRNQEQDQQGLQSSGQEQKGQQNNPQPANQGNNKEGQQSGLGGQRVGNSSIPMDEEDLENEGGQ
jgi:hypothetical protein